MQNLLLTLIVGSLGGWAGYHLKLPAGALLGSMIAVGIYNVLGFQSFMPAQVRIGIQVVVGCLLGLNLNRAAFAEMKAIVVPLVIIIVVLMIAGLAAGDVIYRFCGLDLRTAFLGSSPGGMTELSLLAVSLGADGPKVALIHSVRMITVVALMPTILNILDKLLGPK